MKRSILSAICLFSVVVPAAIILGWRSCGRALDHRYSEKSLRALYSAWALYRQENDGVSPQSLQHLACSMGLQTGKEQLTPFRDAIYLWDGSIKAEHDTLRPMFAYPVGVSSGRSAYLIMLSDGSLLGQVDE